MNVEDETTMYVSITGWQAPSPRIEHCHADSWRSNMRYCLDASTRYRSLVGGFDVLSSWRIDACMM